MPERGTHDRVTRYRTIGVAEKRAQLEAAGEPWPIGSDGLPKVWHTDARRSAGGYWNIRSTSRAARQRYSCSEKGASVQARYEESRIQVRVAGTSTTYRIKADKKKEIKERLAAFREHQARTRKEIADNGWIN